MKESFYGKLIKIGGKVIEPNNVYNVNNIEGYSQLENSSIDLIVTSPPYDKMRDYNGFDLDLHKICEESFRVLKDGGMLMIVIQDQTKDFAKSCTTYRTILDCVDNIGFRLFENCIYSRHGNSGAWWNTRFRVDHEYILMFLKGKKPKFFDKELLKVDSKYAGKEWVGTDRYSDGSLRKITGVVAAKKCRGTIWNYSASNTEGNRLKLKHPATFPDKLAEDLILCFSQENDIILDPMCGSGTTLVMAKKHNRKFIGFDISDEYIEITNNRLKIEA